MYQRSGLSGPLYRNQAITSLIINFHDLTIRYSTTHHRLKFKLLHHSITAKLALLNQKLPDVKISDVHNVLAAEIGIFNVEFLLNQTKNQVQLVSNLTL